MSLHLQEMAVCTETVSLKDIVWSAHLYKDQLAEDPQAIDYILSLAIIESIYIPEQRLCYLHKNYLGSADELIGGVKKLVKK